DLADREPQPGLERLLVDPLAARARPHHVEQVARARQAARMGGEDAVGAALHSSVPPQAGGLGSSIAGRRGRTHLGNPGSVGRWAIFPHYQRVLKAGPAITQANGRVVRVPGMAIDGQTAEKLRGFLRELTPRARAMLLAELERGGAPMPGSDIIIR